MNKWPAVLLTALVVLGGCTDPMDRLDEPDMRPGPDLAAAQRSPLQAIWGADASNIWVGGAAILKWDGSGWHTDKPVDISGLWGVDASNVWAVSSAGKILKGDYDPPIRTYTDPRMEMSCQLPACPSQVMSTFRTLHEQFGTFS